MAFQDFDAIKERRKAERERKFRQRLIIGSVATLLLIGLVFAGLFVLNNNAQKEKDDKTDNSETSSQSKKSHSTNAHHAQPPKATPKAPNGDMIVGKLCNATRYKDSCEKSLKDAVKNETSLTQPKVVLKASITSVNDEIDKAFNNTMKLKFDTDEEKAAIEDCKSLVDDAREELQDSIDKLNQMEVSNYGKVSPELDNWLSAVMSYQATCVDGFPDGKTKSDVEKELNSSQASTSNSLAVVKQLGMYFATLKKVPGVQRRLLELHNLEKDGGGVPSWMSHDDRRILKSVNVSALHPNVTVAQDGSGDFKTISEALKAMPEKHDGRYVIYVKAGIYDETVTVEKKMVNVTMVGEGSKKTVVTGSKNFVAKVQTFKTATFAALGNGFMAQSMGFRNTAGPEGHQAVALRVQSDRSIFLNCRFDGYQDTLYVQTHRQFYRSCVITGTVDFIFGDASAVFQNCDIFIRKGMSGQQNTVTAHGRTDPFETTGIVLQKCNITADEDLISAKKDFKSYLGRPWKRYSRTVVMESDIDDTIDPAGWLKWQDTDFGIDTLTYGEYGNEGDGANTEKRVKWPGYKNINKEEALNYTVGPFLQGEWIKAMETPVQWELFKA